MDVISMQRQVEYGRHLLELASEMRETEELSRKDLARWLEDEMLRRHTSLPSAPHTACSYYCNPQLKSHFDSILPLSSLVINHAKALQSALASMFPASDRQGGQKEIDKIKYYI